MKNYKYCVYLKHKLLMQKLIVKLRTYFRQLAMVMLNFASGKSLQSLECQRSKANFKICD